MKIIKIGAEWCMGCLVMRPRMAQIEAENPKLKTEYYDFDKDKEVVKKYGLEKGKLPVFIFLGRDGSELERLVGELSKKKILELVNKYENS
ncbi:MAG: thioredoxin family protein [bacterium]